MDAASAVETGDLYEHDAQLIGAHGLVVAMDLKVPLLHVVQIVFTSLTEYEPRGHDVVAADTVSLKTHDDDKDS